MSRAAPWNPRLLKPGSKRHGVSVFPGLNRKTKRKTQMIRHRSQRCDTGSSLCTASESIAGFQFRYLFKIHFFAGADVSETSSVVKLLSFWSPSLNRQETSIEVIRCRCCENLISNRTLPNGLGIWNVLELIKREWELCFFLEKDQKEVTSNLWNHFESSVWNPELSLKERRGSSLQRRHVHNRAELRVWGFTGKGENC